MILIKFISSNILLINEIIYRKYHITLTLIIVNINCDIYLYYKNKLYFINKIF